MTPKNIRMMNGNGGENSKYLDTRSNPIINEEAILQNVKLRFCLFTNSISSNEDKCGLIMSKKPTQFPSSRYFCKELYRGNRKSNQSDTVIACVEVSPRIRK